MLPGDAIMATQPLGLYWESYGHAPGDRLDIEVRVTGGRQSFVRRAIASLGLGARSPMQRRTAWTEIVREDPGIVARSITLNLETLPPGGYLLTVEVRTNGGAPVSSNSSLNIFR